MAIKVKDAAASAAKFTQRAAAAAPDYAKGVQGAGNLWQQNSGAANDSYVAGVTAAANAGRYKKGVDRAGGNKYETNAAGKGAEHVARFQIAGLRPAQPRAPEAAIRVVLRGARWNPAVSFDHLIGAQLTVRWYASDRAHLHIAIEADQTA